MIRSSGKQIILTDGVSVKSLGISQAIPDENTECTRNLKRLLSGLNKYMQGYVPGVLITEFVEASDPRISED